MKLLTTTLALLIFALFSSLAQTPGEGYKFTMVKQLPATNVKNQSNTNTCWDFSAVSVLESELIRMGKGEFDLSEMFVAYHAYLQKAAKYVRMHGNTTFAGGGENNDVVDVIRKWGIVPETAYSGLKPKETAHNHVEMDKLLKSYVDGIVQNQNQVLSPVWMKGFESILQSYLGEIPEKFTYNNKEYTPKSFAASLGLNPDDYVLITSFTHHPFYKPFVLEIPDNWSWGEVYNVPLDELIEIIDNAVNTGYTVGWASDVSDKGFNMSAGVAIVPDAGDKISSKEWEKYYANPCAQRKIDPDLRQLQFDNYATTDDHGMHLTGIAKDQSGNKFYYVKNSWGTENMYKGYLYVSESYVRLKTTVIFLNKNALSETIRKKLGI